MLENFTAAGARLRAAIATQDWSYAVSCYPAYRAALTKLEALLHPAANDSYPNFYERPMPAPHWYY